MFTDCQDRKGAENGSGLLADVKPRKHGEGRLCKKPGDMWAIISLNKS